MRNHRWVRRWRQRRHRKKAERSKQGALREFVYLDEVSVYSLMASQVGLIVTELTETQATSLQSEVSSGLGLSAPLKAQVGSKIQAGENQSSQVLRKAIIQTTFKQLHDTATKSGALRLRVIEDDVPSVNTWDDVSRLAHDESASWVVNPSRLRRGDLVELDVRLEAEPIFQAEAMISGVLEIIQDDPAAFGVQDFGGLGQTRLVSRMLDKVLAGLVPVRGRATNYEVVEIDGEEWLLHTSLWSQLGQSPVPSRPVHLVGVAEQGQFWKDVRRVLFSDSSYRVLARLNRTGLQQSWTPVKLVDVLRNVVPDFAEVMDNMNRGVLSAMSTAVAAQQDTSPTHRVRAATVEYATLLGERAGVKINEDELEIAGLFDHQITDADINVRDWREMLARVTAFIEERTGLTFDRDVASDYRVAAITRAGLLEPAAAPVSAFETGPAEPPKERFLDAEIVAVYW